MMHTNLPVKIGEPAECRSFLQGYRGGWFRCKIKEVRYRRKEIECALEYTDFPDEVLEWSKLYQVGHGHGQGQGRNKLRTVKKHLMVRPPYPPIYRDNQLPDINSISEVVVVINDVWKVGDLVDWWTDNVYWSGTITEILGEGKYRLDLHPPPEGEGSTYEALGKDCRPSLDWSPTDGWILPNTGRENCARLLKPRNPGGSQDMEGHASEEVRKSTQEKDGDTPENDVSFSSHVSANSLLPVDKSEQRGKQPLSPTACKETAQPQAQEANMAFDVSNAGAGKSSFSDSVSSSHVREDTVEVAGMPEAKRARQLTEETIPLHSSSSNTIEASILDLEELLTRVKWMKGLLEEKDPSSTRQYSWKFQEHLSSSRKK